MEVVVVQGKSSSSPLATLSSAESAKNTRQYSTERNLIESFQAECETTKHERANSEGDIKSLGSEPKHAAACLSDRGGEINNNVTTIAPELNVVDDMSLNNAVTTTEKIDLK